MGYTTHPAEESVAFGMSAISDVAAEVNHLRPVSRHWPSASRRATVSLPPT